MFDVSIYLGSMLQQQCLICKHKRCCIFACVKEKKEREKTAATRHNLQDMLESLEILAEKRLRIPNSNTSDVLFIPALRKPPFMNLALFEH